MKKTIRVLAVVFLLGATITPASALSYYGSQYGQHTFTNGTFISLKDAYGDGLFPSTIYKFAGGTQESSLVNKSGYGTTVTKYAPSTITAIMPCLSRWAQPMACGNWIYDK
ncbi:hypothetical protein [Gleimia coleocanis]|nr:hypothetical protein [Gleimia coleocanis]